MDIFTAIAQGNLLAVKKYLPDNHVNLKHPTTGLNLPLLAAIHDHTHIVDYLCQQLKIPFAISIMYCPDYFGGLGDQILTLKLTQVINEIMVKYHYAGDLLYIMDDFQINKRTETLIEYYGVNIISRKKYYQLLRNKHIKIDYYIHGPLLNYFLITQPQTIVTLLKEYSFTPPCIDEIKKQYKKLRYKRLNVLATGFANQQQEIKYKQSEQGVLFTQDLIVAAEAKAKQPQLFKQYWQRAWQALPQNLKHILLENKQLESYGKTHAFCFEYSHCGKYNDTYQSNHHEHYLKVHIAYMQYATKNQDVLALGEDVKLKKLALANMLPLLLKQGYSQIIYIDVDNNETKIIHNEHANGKIFRYLHMHKIPHPAMLALFILCEDLVGVTGDQSLCEAISANKIIVYECMEWKQKLIHDYIDLVGKYTNNDAIKKLMLLLLIAKTNEDYEQIKNLFNQQTLLQQLKQANQKIIAEHNLAKAIQYYFTLEFSLKWVRKIESYIYPYLVKFVGMYHKIVSV